MSVAKRPFSDLRNTYVVDNNDPGAFDKSYAGKPGTHTEQRCCGDKAPYMEQTFGTTGYVINAQGQRLHISTLRDSQGRTGYDADIPAGYGIEQVVLHQELWCKECSTAAESAWGEFVENLSGTLQVMGPILRGIALAASYIPVFGTAVSFVLSTALNLAEGQRLDDATMEAIGAALPGQPASGILYNTTRAFLQGDRIDKTAVGILVDSVNLPVGAEQKKYITQTITTVSSIFVSIARGQSFTNAALSSLYVELPDEGKKAMDIARRLASGERVLDVTVSEAAQAAANTARAKGPAAINQYITEAAYQAALGTLDPLIQGALKTAFLASEIQQAQNMESLGFTTQEQNVTGNDALALKGQNVIKGGAGWRGRSLYAIRNGSTLTITVQVFDPLANRVVAREMTYDIDSFWRRGFDVAVGLCEGVASDSPSQQKVRATLVNVHEQQGFDAGQQIQFERTAAHAQAKSATATKVSHSALTDAIFGPSTKGKPMPSIDTPAQSAPTAPVVQPVAVAAAAAAKPPMSGEAKAAIAVVGGSAAIGAGWFLLKLLRK